eukprot:499758-Amphidinium_carterae.1
MRQYHGLLRVHELPDETRDLDLSLPHNFAWDASIRGDSHSLRLSFPLLMMRESSKSVPPRLCGVHHRLGLASGLQHFGQLLPFAERNRTSSRHQGAVRIFTCMSPVGVGA